jgi:hypothetical protein
MRTEEKRAMRRASIAAMAHISTPSSSFSVLNLFRGLHPVNVLREGDVVGEAELLQQDANFPTTVVTTEPVEIIELKRDTFESKVREEKATERGRILNFLQSLPTLCDATMAECYGIATASTTRVIERDHRCLAHPPNASLGAASFSYACVCIVLSGEARLLAAPLAHSDADAPAASNAAPPATSPAAARMPRDGKPPAKMGAAHVTHHLGSSSKAGADEAAWLSSKQVRRDDPAWSSATADETECGPLAVRMPHTRALCLSRAPRPFVLSP